MTESLEDRIALVTGGGRGLGRAISIHLAAAGCSHICINYRSNESSARDTQSFISSHHPSSTVHLYRADVSSPSEATAMIRSIQSTLGPISILVNNAGISSIRPDVKDVTLEDFDAMHSTNCRSAFVCTQAVIAGMEAQRWGRIVNITSIAAYYGGVTGPHYASSKAAMIGLTNSYAHRLIKSGITSNAVAPGMCESDMLDEMMRVVGKEKVIGNTAAGRLGTADEVAAVVVMLARNGYVNGQTICVDGGIHKK